MDTKEQIKQRNRDILLHGLDPNHCECSYLDLVDSDDEDYNEFVVQSNLLIAERNGE